MTCNECIHKAVCYRVDSVPSDYARTCGDFVSDCKALEQEPCEDMVHVETLHQVMWERDIAIRQLKELGYEFGQKIEPCEDAISREDAKEIIAKNDKTDGTVPIFTGKIVQQMLDSLPSVTPSRKTGHCKDCKYFEYDSVAKVDGVPLIVAHEICSKWGDGCKTKEGGYCFLYEPQERSEEQA